MKPSVPLRVHLVTFEHSQRVTNVLNTKKFTNKAYKLYLLVLYISCHACHSHIGHRFLNNQKVIRSQKAWMNGGGPSPA